MAGGDESPEQHAPCQDTAMNNTSSLTDSLTTLVHNHFNCGICMELVYKPVVHACGHMFCFWCVHHSMNSITESHCPLCRRAYTHFPWVCERLHFFLLKALPEEYGLRAKEVQEEEEEMGVSSPQFSEMTLASSEDLCMPQVEEPQLQLLEKASDCLQGIQDSVASHSSASSHATVHDLLCKFCSKLLYKPVILNCGHVFCQGCVKRSEGTVLSCPTCQRPHPGQLALVCLELQQFLQNAFPFDYLKRQEEVGCQEREQSGNQHALLRLQAKQLAGEAESCEECDFFKIHFGCGCDGCGMMPIIGQRFKCEDCPKSIGFDLCLDCYKIDPHQMGRFNQRHTREHRISEVTELEFVLVPPEYLENQIPFSDLVPLAEDSGQGEILL